MNIFPRFRKLFRYLLIDREETFLSFLSRLIMVVSPASLAGGALAGAVAGLLEAIWMTTYMVNPDELRSFIWGPVVYAMLFSGCGLSIGTGLYFMAYIFRYRPNAERFFFVAAGGSLVAGLLVIGRWRYARDVLEGGVPTVFESVTLAASALLIGFIIERAGTWFFRRLPISQYTQTIVATVPLLCVLAIGVGLATWLPAKPAARAVDIREASMKRRIPTVAPEHAPNIIFIVVDTLRADVLSCYSDHAPAPTENFDQLACDGILFSSCFAASPWTKPSFATLFTGVHPEIHGALVAGDRLPESAVTIAELLQNTGYYTQAFSNNWHIHALYGFDQGFSSYVCLEPRLLLWATPSARLLSLYELVRRIHFRLILRGIDVTFFYQPADIVNKAAFEWLDSSDRTDNAPFFLFLHYMDPHDPFMDPERPGKGYALIDLGWDPPAKYLQPMRRSYDYDIQFMDAHLGKLLEGLRARSLYDDTLIILTSDHGEEFYEHGGWWHAQTLFTEVLHVPLIIKLPGNTHAKTIEDGLVRHIDIAPTILSLIGLEQPEAMCGSALLYEDGAPRNFRAEFAHASTFHEGSLLRSIQTPHYKLHEITRHWRRSMAPVKFYDLRNDPGEQNNLAGQGIPDEEHLRTLLHKLTKEMQEAALNK